MPFTPGHYVVVAQADGKISPNVVSYLRRTGLSTAGVVDVTAYGADPTGQADPRPAIRAAVAAAPAGSVIYFPPGRYVAPFVDAQTAGAYIEIDKPLTFAGESAELRNVLIYAHGAYEALRPLSAPVEEGQRTITQTAHGWAAGDYVQLLSQYNVYTADAGIWQNGGPNPTTGKLTEVRTGEIHRVQGTTADTLTFHDLTTFGGYRTSTAGLASPMEGVSSAHVRRLRLLEGLRFTGLRFTFDAVTGFRGILLRACAQVRFDRCQWSTPGVDGSPVRLTDCHGVRFIDCVSERAWSEGTKIDTTVYVGGGVTRVGFHRCTFSGDAQGVDVTSQTWNNVRDIGYNTDAVAYGRTAQHIVFRECEFYENEEGALTHPATYHLSVTGCTFSGGSTGFRSRTRHAVFSGCTFYTSRAGIALSSFADDTTISACKFRQAPSPKTGYASYWHGVSYNAFGSEILTGNAVQNLTISACTFRASTAYSWNWGIILEVSGNETFAAFNDTHRRGLSSITITGNHFHGCSALVNKYVHGATILRNDFAGGSDQPYYIAAEPESSATIIGNHFSGMATRGHVRTAGSELDGYTYDNRHTVGMNTASGVALAMDLTNTQTPAS